MTFPLLVTAQVIVVRRAASAGAVRPVALGALVQSVVWWPLCRLVANAAGITLGAVDWLAGGAVLVALWLGWFQVVSVLGRGFSLQLMVELDPSPRGLDALVACYAGGRGIDWLLDKRIRDLEGFGLAARDGETLRLTGRGLWLARLARGYKTATGIGAGG
ncbi:MAG: hypothetical protein AAGC60_22760 [Acidobacteriota bacterium]